MLPFVIKRGMPKSAFLKWKKQFVNTKRDTFESLWRRTQDPKNATDSGWLNENDKRRRMLHFYDKYDLIDSKGQGYDLVVSSPYLWLHLALPKNEIEEYHHMIIDCSKKADWTLDKNGNGYSKYKKENLVVEVRILDKHPEDLKANREFPTNYDVLEFIFRGDKTVIPKYILHKPWEVLASGIRKKDIRGNPKIISDLKDIKKYLPMQVELGCGPSVEAGIPPLYYLHKVYYVMDTKTHKFIFVSKRDKLIRDLMINPTAFYKRSAKMYLSSIESKITPFYKLLKKLYKSGLIVGPVITNNFDGFSSLIDVPETYVRRYDEAHIVPKIKFDKRAKSLLVVGSHADRRRIQQAARNSGLKVVYIDPEGYFDKDKFIYHPLESPQDDDLLFRGTSKEFASAWEKAKMVLIK